MAKYRNQRNSNRSTGTFTSRSARSPRPSASPRQNDTFHGLEIQPTEYDDVSEVTEQVMTVATHGSSPYYDAGHDDVERPRMMSEGEETFDDYDNFVKNVFKTPTTEYEIEKPGRNTRLILLGLLVFIVMGVAGALIGTGVFQKDGSDDSSSSSASNSLIETTETPTGAPITSMPTESSQGTTVTNPPTSAAGTTIGPGSTSAPTTANPTPNPTTSSPTFPDATAFPTKTPVATPNPTVAPSPVPTVAATASPTSTPITKSPTLPPTVELVVAATPIPTISTTPPPTNEPEIVVETDPFTLTRLSIRMEEVPYADFLTIQNSDSNESRNIYLEIRVGGNTYRSPTCSVSSCDLYTTIGMYEWLSFPDTTSWFMDGDSSSTGGGPLSGSSMDLTIHVESHGKYVWEGINTSNWGSSAQAGYETVNSKDVNGNGYWMRWQFDVYPASA